MGRELRFECQSGCIDCCTQSGFVYLNDEDVARAAAFVGLTAEEFEKRYVYRTRRKMRLRVAKHARCPFLLEGGCSIHPAKPLQCRTFPFWPELVESAREWKKAARRCRGIGHGPLIQIETARTVAEEMRRGLPVLYEE